MVLTHLTNIAGNSARALTVPIVGATKPNQFDDAIASVNVKLCSEEIAALKEPYVPHAGAGFE